jgi:hypothetical protein
VNWVRAGVISLGARSCLPNRQNHSPLLPLPTLLNHYGYHSESYLNASLVPLVTQMLIRRFWYTQAHLIFSPKAVEKTNRTSTHCYLHLVEPKTLN